MHSNIIFILNERNGRERKDGRGKKESEEAKDVGTNNKPNNL
jgi:hypothetical protein